MRPKSRFIIIAVCLFIYFFLVFDINFFGPDEPVYFAYTESLVKDGDLNLVNQVYNDYGRFITATGNMPDFHDHAGVSLWAPFFIYGRVIHFLSEKLKIGRASCRERV